MQAVAVESQESPLGRWTAAHWVPPTGSVLAGSVERIWYFDGAMTHRKERVFPNGAAELIVMLDEPHRDGDAALEPFPAICINGCRTQPSVVVSPRGRCRVLGIRFTPPGACAFLRSNMTDMVDVTIDLRDAIGPAAEELGERCAAASQVSAWNGTRNASAVVTAATQWLMRRAPGDDDPVVRWATTAIRVGRGVLSLDRLGAQLAVSRPEFVRRFRNRTGLTPKRYARTVRFHHALMLLGRMESIAAVAAELEYYDQAHLYRDFAEFGRLTPREFLLSKRYPESPSLAEE